MAAEATRTGCGTRRAVDEPRPARGAGQIPRARAGRYHVRVAGEAPSPNPLSDDTPAAWDRLIESLHPASMLVAVRSRMGAAMLARRDPEDVWQEALLTAWNARQQIEWRGLSSFRRWLLVLVDRRIKDLCDHDRAEKRGGAAARPHPAHDQGAQPSTFAGPSRATTPSRAASDREQAAHLQAALALVPDLWRDVVRLRAFEGMTLAEAAATLGITLAAVRHRFHRGMQAFQVELQRLRGADSSLAARIPGAGTAQDARSSA